VDFVDPAHHFFAFIMTHIQVRVSSKRIEAEGVATFELRPLAGQLPPFSAGAHIDVLTPGGMVRQYSLCNSPTERDRYLIGVLRESASRGGSVAMHDMVSEGDLMTISEPRNHFPLVPGGKFILFAGGIGITPILSMAETLHTMGGDFEVHYCTRSADRTAFLKRIAQSPFAARVRFYHDDDAAQARLDCGTVLANPQPGVHLYTCGPGGFIDYVCATAKALGWPQAQVHVEYFAAAAPIVQGGDAAFDVKLASSGEIVRIGAGETVVAGLARHGIAIPMSCEQGVCGTCITRVLEGTPDHRDSYFTDQERASNEEFTPCCSRAKSLLLVLDL
jgi:vanillate O-demethylase ferredoxin subunit